MASLLRKSATRHHSWQPLSTPECQPNVSHDPATTWSRLPARSQAEDARALRRPKDPLIARRTRQRDRRAGIEGLLASLAPAVQRADGRLRGPGFSDRYEGESAAVCIARGQLRGRGGYAFDTFLPERITRHTFRFFGTLMLVGLVLLALGWLGVVGR